MLAGKPSVEASLSALAMLSILPTQNSPSAPHSFQRPTESLSNPTRMPPLLSAPSRDHLKVTSRASKRSTSTPRMMSVPPHLSSPLTLSTTNGSITSRPCKPLSPSRHHNLARTALLMAQLLFSTWMARRRQWAVLSCPWILNMSLPLRQPALLHTNGRFQASHLLFPPPRCPSSCTLTTLNSTARVTIRSHNPYVDQDASQLEDKVATFHRAASTTPTLPITRLIPFPRQAPSPICRLRPTQRPWMVYWCTEAAIKRPCTLPARSIIRRPSQTLPMEAIRLHPRHMTARQHS